MKYLVFLASFCGFIFPAEAQKKDQQGFFHGHIRSDLDSIQLRAFFTKNYIIGQGEAENIFFNIPVNRNGYFHFSLPEISHPGRLTIYDAFSGNSLLTHQIVEPGDHISIEAIIHDQEEPRYCHAQFAGKGSSKYTCTQRLKDSRTGQEIFKEKDTRGIEKIEDSCLSIRMDLLRKFEARLSQQEYLLLKADIIGEIKIKVLALFADAYSSPKIPLATEEKRNEFDVLFSRHDSIPDAIQAESPSYTGFLYEKEKIQLAYEYKGKNFGIKELYNRLRNKYAGILREKLLAYCLLNGLDIALFFETVDADDFTNCINDAVRLIQTAWLKAPVDELLKAKGKGAPAFDFVLPADSSNRMRSLLDFRGKVVLIDMWAYQCTACYLFTKAFHEKIFPIFRTDSNFVVISIMSDPSTRDAYLRRLRNFGHYSYTYPDYINLFGGKGEEMGRQMDRHYNVNAWPLILLVDKKGNIYSSTVPFFTDPGSPNVDRLKKLIAQAMNSPS